MDPIADAIGHQLITPCLRVTALIDDLHFVEHLRGEGHEGLVVLIIGIVEVSVVGVDVALDDGLEIEIQKQHLGVVVGHVLQVDRASQPTARGILAIIYRYYSGMVFKGFR